MWLVPTDTFTVRSLLMVKYFPDNLFQHFHLFKHCRHQEGDRFLQRSSISSHSLSMALGSIVIGTISKQLYKLVVEMSLEKPLCILLLIQLMVPMHPSNSNQKSPHSFILQSIAVYVQSILLFFFPYVLHLFSMNISVRLDYCWDYYKCLKFNLFASLLSH